MNENVKQGLQKSTGSSFSISQVESAFHVGRAIVKYSQKSGTSELPQILSHLSQLGSKEGGASWHPQPVYVGWRGGCLRHGWAGRGMGVCRQSPPVPYPCPAGEFVSTDFRLDSHPYIRGCHGQEVGGG